MAPDGTGEGTFNNPMSLSAALAQGGVINLLPGVYTGDLFITTPNTTLRSMPGTRAIIDGDVQVWGDGVVLEGLELTLTEWTTRTTEQAGGTPTDIPWMKGLSIYGPRTRILDCYIHDMPNGVGWWKPAIDSEIRGCLIYNNGWQGADRGHGPGIYAQNDTGVKLCRDNIILPSYSYTGFQFYGSQATALLHFHIENNIIVQTRFLVGSSSTPVDDIHAVGNLLYRRDIEIGYKNPLNGSAEIRDNYIGRGSIVPHALQELQMTDNTVVNMGGLAVMDLQPPNAPYDYTIDGNTYHSDQPIVFWDGAEVTDFLGWQYDAGGSFGPLPTEPKVFVRQTRPHHGYVAIYNWGNESGVTVDLSPLSLTPGASYKLVNALNPAEVHTFTATPTVSLPISTGWTVAIPYGATAPLTTWSSQFAVFLVEPST